MEETSIDIQSHIQCQKNERGEKNGHVILHELCYILHGSFSVTLFFAFSDVTLSKQLYR